MFATAFEVYNSDNTTIPINYLSPGATIDLTGVNKATVCFVPSNPSLIKEINFWLTGSNLGTDKSSPYCMNDQKNKDEPKFRANGSHTLNVTVFNTSNAVIATASVSYTIINGKP